MCLIFLVLLGCRDSDKAKPHTSLQTVTVTAAHYVNRPITLTAYGSLEASKSTIIRPEASGIITQIFFPNGSAVKKGDVIFQLNDSKAQADLKVAEANLRLAQINYERDKPLLKSGAISQHSWDIIATKLQTQKATVQSLKAVLKYKKVIAPYDGHLGKRAVNLGAFVNVGNPMTNIVNTDVMKVDYQLPGSDADLVKMKQRVLVSIPAIKNKYYQGQVTFIASKINPGARTIGLEAYVNNSDGKQLPGMFSQIIQTIQPVHKVLVIPGVAVRANITGKYVFKVVNNRAKQVKVTLLPIPYNNDVIIKSGLNPGDQVITSFAYNVKNNDPVKIATH